MDRNIDPVKDVFVAWVEHDTAETFRSRGPIIMETYTGQADLPKMVKRARMMQTHGQVMMCKVVPVGTLEECERFINEEYFPL